jgi:hypothetical protein
MKNTRRAFAWSSLGIGAAYARGIDIGSSRGGNQPTSVRLHEDPKLSCFEVNLARGFGSDLVATFGRAAPGTEAGEVAMVLSRDGARTWSHANPLANFSSGHQLAGLARLSDGSLLASTTKFGFLFEGKLAWRKDSETEGVFVSKSKDGGHHWDDARKLDIAPFATAWTRGSIIEMPDGSLLLPLAGQKRGRYQRAGEPVASFLMRSSNQGATWAYHSIISRDVHGSNDYDEPAMVSLGGERLLCMLRKHESIRQAPAGGYLHMTMSEDGGATWSKTQPTSMWGHPAHLLRLRDGRVLCTYGYRMHPNPGVKGCVSEDGTAWKPGNIFSIQEVADLDSDRLQIGCPSSVQLDDGGILTGYQVWSENKAAGTQTGAAQNRQRLEGSLYRV